MNQKQTLQYINNSNINNNNIVNNSHYNDSNNITININYNKIV